MASQGSDPLTHRHRHHHCHRHHHHHYRHHHHLHHHHHRVFSPCCLHNHHFRCHRQGFHNVTPHLPQNSESFAPVPIGNNSNAEAAEYNEPESSAAHISQDLERLDLDEEEDDEPIFVLTDEWRDFFAKSEARRQLGEAFGCLDWLDLSS
ncbi:SKI/DACH domain-containing protein 1-like [Senna tora]|uniref:SKI/DACH domain-containing protein 1-like n=1 Tax=Senna tora TaxID=362788 RepID=A0A834WJS5_9FABA|nr:SKI/DACH domain-containing protein 1-like [Senna tora]